MPLTCKDLLSAMKVAETAAKAAGVHLTHKTDRTVYRRIGKDVKLQADLEAETQIREILYAQSPFPIVGEEQGGDLHLMKKEEPYWVVDPLDGTYNYLRRCPLCCISVALMVGMKPILGVIYDFNLGECYAGAQGLGITLNKQKIIPQWAESIEEASILTGFPAHRTYHEQALLTFAKEVQVYQKVRMLGSATLALAYVAIGRADVYYEDCIYLWDVAAGLALLNEAGGYAEVMTKPQKPFALSVKAAGKKELILPLAY